MDQRTISAVSDSTAAPWGTRRPPRSDGELRERPVRLVLPGWIALLAVPAALAVALLVQARRAALPDGWAGAARLDSALDRLDDLLGVGRAPLPPTLVVALLGCCALVVVAALFGLMVNPAGTARVLTRWGRYRGTVRRTGLLWVNPLLKRHTVDVRVRHWRSEPVLARDREGSPIRAELLLVWAVRDTARARLAVRNHRSYLAVAGEAALCRVAATLPCDNFASPGPSLRDGQWLDGELTRLLAAETSAVGITVYSAQAVALDYTDEFASAMRRRRLAGLDAGTRELIVGDALETAATAVSRLERSQGVSLDATGRAELVRDLVTAFLTLSPGSAAAHGGEPGSGTWATPGSGTSPGTVPDSVPRPAPGPVAAGFAATVPAPGGASSDSTWSASTAPTTAFPLLDGALDA